MRIAVISDLHLGFRDRSDRFGHDPNVFMQFLDDLERRMDLIIVNGDLYETWQGARYARPREALTAIRRAYPILTQRLHAPPYRLIYGNHDPLLALEGVAREIEIEDNGLRILFTHGHRWDPLLKSITPLAYTFSWATGWLVRGDDPWRAAVSSWRARFEQRFLWNVQPSAYVDAPEQATCPYQRGALNLLAARPELDLIVCGHTHVPAQCHSEHGAYLNSGAIAGGNLVWVELNTLERTWNLHTS